MPRNDPTAYRPKGGFPPRNKLTPLERERRRRADIKAGMSPEEAYKRAQVREEGSPDRRKQASTARKDRSLTGRIRAKLKSARKPGEVQARGRATLEESRKTGGVPGTKPVPGKKKAAAPAAKKTAPKPAASSGRPRPRPAPKKKAGGDSGGSFKQAFANARAAGKAEFTWKGKRYAAVTRDEVKKSGAKNLREFLNNRKRSKKK